MDVIIYSLADPRDDTIRYVGKTFDLVSRLKDHVKDSKRRNNRKCTWIRSLLKIGLKPKIEPLEVIENSDDEDWQNSERFWISYLKFIGCKLVNGTTGGESGKRHSEETKRRISEVKKAQKIRGWNKGLTGFPATFKGCKHSDASKLKIRLAALGRIPYNKGKKTGKPSWNKGIPMTESAKENLRRFRTGRKTGLSWNRGKKLSAEHKEKIRASCVARNVIQNIKGAARG